MGKTEALFNSVEWQTFSPFTGESSLHIWMKKHSFALCSVQDTAFGNKWTVIWFQPLPLPSPPAKKRFKNVYCFVKMVRSQQNLCLQHSLLEITLSCIIEASLKLYHHCSQCKVLLFHGIFVFPNPATSATKNKLSVLSGNKSSWSIMGAVSVRKSIKLETTFFKTFIFLLWSILDHVFINLFLAVATIKLYVQGSLRKKIMTMFLQSVIVDNKTWTWGNNI